VGGRGGAAEERRWRCCGGGSRAVSWERSTEREGGGWLYLELRDENVTLNNASAAEQTAGRELSARCNMQPLQWSKRPGLIERSMKSIKWNNATFDRLYAAANAATRCNECRRIVLAAARQRGAEQGKGLGRDFLWRVISNNEPYSGLELFKNGTCD
jgi:hypothetical protein